MNTGHPVSSTCTRGLAAMVVRVRVMSSSSLSLLALSLLLPTGCRA